MKKFKLGILAAMCLCATAGFAACNGGTANSSSSSGTTQESTGGEDVATYFTVKVETNAVGYGMVTVKNLTNVEEDTAIRVDGNRLFVGDVEIVATASANTAQYTYAFTGFTGVPETVTENVTITANFTRTVNQYTITFETGEGTALEPITADYGVVLSKISAEGITAPEHYHFEKWQIKTADGTYVDLDGTEVLSENVTLKAVYALDTYTVVWKDGDIVLETDTVKYGETASYDGKIPEKAGCVFQCWKLDSEVIDPSTYIVTEDLEFVAFFERDKSFYRIESFSADTKVGAGDFYNETETMLWGTETISSISGASEEDNAKVNGDMLCLNVTQAHAWNDQLHTDFNGIITDAFNSMSYDYVTLKVYLDYTAPASWIRVIFSVGETTLANPNGSGWLTLKITREAWTAAGGKLYIKTTMANGEAMQFKVYFDEIIGNYETPVEYVTVTFDTNGAGELEAKQVEKGAAIGELPVLKKEGFAFKGWAVDGELIDASYVVNGDVELVATFEEIKVSDNLVEDFSDLSKFSYEQFAVGLNTKVTGISVVTNISNATAEENAQANGEMFAVSVNTWLGANCYVKTNFGGIIQNAFDTTEYDYLVVKTYIDHQASGIWYRVLFGVGSNQAMVYERGWYELKITREDWAKDPYFWMQPNPSGAHDVNLVFTIYFDEITGAFNEVSDGDEGGTETETKIVLESFSDISKFSYEDFTVGLNTKVTGISVVTNISNASAEENAQANGEMFAVQVNTWLHANCYVKTGLGGVIQNAFDTTDAEYIIVKVYIDHQPSRSWDRVYFGVGSNQVMVYERGWYELKITREEWKADPNFYMQPNPSGAGDVNLIFTVYFDEIYIDKSTEE